MTDKEICHLTAAQLSRLIQKREISPVEVTETYLSRISSLEPILNSFIRLLPERAIESAKEAEREILSGSYRGPLQGIPLGLKDVFYVKGLPNTMGSKIFENLISDFDSTVARRLNEAGAIFLGKLNLQQLAYGATGENADYGNMHNPWNPNMIAGGSSGGSASAIVSGECAIAMGTDTGGSIRIPGAICGVVGLKPTYGRISRFGIPALTISQDHAGPMAKTVEDCALILNAVAGYDPKDRTSAKFPVPDYTKALSREIQGLRIGVPKQFFECPLDPEVERAVYKAIQTLGELGASIIEVSWPMFNYAIAIGATIVVTEATSYCSHFVKTQGHLLMDQVRMRLESGFFIPAIDYLKAQRARTLFCREALELFKKIDVVAGPTLPICAFEIGRTEVKVRGIDRNVTQLLTQYSRPFNLTGFPAMTLPCGFSKDRLPIGLQLAGKPFSEETILSVGYAYEQATDWHNQRPDLSTHLNSVKGGG